MIGCKKHLIKTRNNEVLFIKQYIDLIELLDLNINRKIAISFYSIVKYLDDDTKERIQKITKPHSYPNAKSDGTNLAAKT